MSQTSSWEGRAGIQFCANFRYKRDNPHPKADFFISMHISCIIGFARLFPHGGWIYFLGKKLEGGCPWYLRNTRLK